MVEAEIFFHFNPGVSFLLACPITDIEKLFVPTQAIRIDLNMFDAGFILAAFNTMALELSRRFLRSTADLSFLP